MWDVCFYSQMVCINKVRQSAPTIFQEILQKILSRKESLRQSQKQLNATVFIYYHITFIINITYIINITFIFLHQDSKNNHNICWWYKLGVQSFNPMLGIQWVAKRQKKYPCFSPTYDLIWAIKSDMVYKYLILNCF